jgi:hypothetical protein
VIGLLYLWGGVPSIRWFLASLAAGAAAGGVLGAAALVWNRMEGWRAHLTATCAGAAGGLAWWVVYAPAAAAWVSVAIGAGLVIGLLILAALGIEF